VRYELGTSPAQRDAFGAALLELVTADPRVIVLDGDLANSTKTDVVARARPDRFLQMGIAEQNLVGVAAGLATLGFIPWCATFASFISSRDLDQVRVVVAQPGLGVKLAGCYAGLLTGKTGKTHQDIWDLAVMRAIPGMMVIAPADANELAAAMEVTTALPGPTYIRVTRDPSPVIFPPDYTFHPGRAIVLRQGGDVTIISTGVQTTRVLAAAEILDHRGVQAFVLHVPTVKPIDTTAIVDAAVATGMVVTVEEHTVIGGLGSAVAEVLGERRPTPMRLIGIEDRFGTSAPNDEMLRAFGLAPQQLADAVGDFHAFQSGGGSR
jgi:transketolase